MKKVFMFLVAAMMLGMAMPTMAQQKKAPAKRTTTTKSGTAANRNTATNVAPIKQRDHMEFLGLMMGGDVAQFVKALRQKGFTNGSGFSDDPSMTFLRGNVYGMMSEISIIAENNRVKTVSISNMVDTKAQETSRISRIKKEMITLYGGKWVTSNGLPTLKLPYGQVTYSSGMFDSGVYELGFYITDNGKETPSVTSQDKSQAQTNAGHGQGGTETEEKVVKPEEVAANSKQPDSSLEDFAIINELVHLKDFKKIWEKLSSAGWNPTEPKDDYAGTYFLGKKFSGVSPVTKFHVTVTKEPRKKPDIMLHIKQSSFEKIKDEAAKYNYVFDDEITKKFDSKRKDKKDYYFVSPDGFYIHYMVLDIGPSVTFGSKWW